MLLLGIDSSNVFASLALVRNDSCLARYSERVPMRHAEIIFDQLCHLFDQAKLKPDDVNRIGVSIGPGMFTALRIGLALAKGLAFPHQIPVVPVNTLYALAYPYLKSENYVLPITDARRGLLYTAFFSPGNEKFECSLIKPEELGNLIKDKTVVIGDGVEKYRDLISSFSDRIVIPEPNPISPDPVLIAKLAKIGKPEPIETLEPFYLKKSDAEIDHPERDES